MISDLARRRAENLFKKEQRLREGELAMAEYQAAREATRMKTARLRALRLSRDAAAVNTAARLIDGAVRRDKLGS
jgi:hypothetical protein